MSTRSRAKTAKVPLLRFRWHRHHKKILRFQRAQRSTYQKMARMLHPLPPRKKDHRFRLASFYWKPKTRTLNIPPNLNPKHCYLGQWGICIAYFRNSTSFSATIQVTYKSSSLIFWKNRLKNCWQNTSQFSSNSTKMRSMQTLQSKSVNFPVISKTVKCFCKNWQNQLTTWTLSSGKTSRESFLS